MPCKNTEEVFQRCLQKNISCKHLEDVCEKCLEKEEEEEEEYWTPPLTAVQKRNRILWDLSFLAACGASWYLTTKWYSILAIDLFDSILRTISVRTE